MNWLTPQGVSTILSAIVPLLAVIAFFWKVATKNDIKSLKADTERDVTSLKTDVEGDIKSLKADVEGDIKSLKADIENNIRNCREDLKQVRQDFTNHLHGHPIASSVKIETSHAAEDQRSLKEVITPQKGVFSADEYDERTRS